MSSTRYPRRRRNGFVSVAERTRPTIECRLRGSEGAKALSSSSQHPTLRARREAPSDVDSGKRKWREYAPRGFACQNTTRQSGSLDVLFDATPVPCSKEISG